jgi:signal transduction histidine kinase
MRTPLNTLITSSESLELYTKSIPKAEKLRKVNLVSSKLLLSLVNDILDVY